MKENNELQQKRTVFLKKLNEKERRAIEMRSLGKTSNEIAVATGYNEAYVRNLFMRGGRLEKAYEEFLSNQHRLSQEKVRATLNRAQDEALPAFDRVISLSKKSDNEAAFFKANELILEIAGVTQEDVMRKFCRGKTRDAVIERLELIFKELKWSPLQQKSNPLSSEDFKKRLQNMINAVAEGYFGKIRFKKGTRLLINVDEASEDV